METTTKPPSLRQRVEALGEGETVHITGYSRSSVRSITALVASVWERKFSTNKTPHGVQVWRWK